MTEDTIFVKPNETADHIWNFLNIGLSSIFPSITVFCFSLNLGQWGQRRPFCDNLPAMFFLLLGKQYFQSLFDSENSALKFDF